MNGHEILIFFSRHVTNPFKKPTTEAACAVCVEVSTFDSHDGPRHCRYSFRLFQLFLQLPQRVDVVLQFFFHLE
jgi:hypothetical protein